MRHRNPRLTRLRISWRDRSRSAVRRIHLPALLSTLVAALLVLVGVVRCLSYLRGSVTDALEGTVLGHLTYQPGNRFNVQYFKVLASPSIVGMTYLLFRFFNAGQAKVFKLVDSGYDRSVDFRPPWVRLAVLGVATLHWFAIELFKFNAAAVYSYPYSTLEDPRINALVLLAGGGISYAGMKYFSFGPVLAKRRSDRGQRGGGG